MGILQIKNLTKIYGKDETEVKALNNINIKINKGEFVAIIGKSGSGKSTLLHIMAGLETPTSGHVIIEDINISSLNEKQQSILRREKIGLIFQSYNLIPALTVEENIKLPTININNKNDNYVDELMLLLSINDRKEHLPHQLSGGQQQRVAIARALINKPSIILADEPTGNLDTKSESEVLNLLKKSQKKYNQTIIMITHNMNIAKYAGRVIKIEDGVIRE
ncbi:MULTISPECIES: ABC transporter ATP-binding protein [unclassified Clostridioides]|uniref:ABC transporter ATP-binding protein n=1 Tax=unclassified Clostridioides TaxID=2635829 RepID=UPI001D11B63B|nr:ABC transporter ATP-binding protein [Clostridioides sp. ZZV15-6388]MCC0662780.1 ABC transporter ATP-binding protein [Clostridioides sp. ZZV15-6597]MCC0668915.1 ABC transporter ATP-binding protein [Clostridioides sp. ZZV14-6153]MCC0721607.1 ABC transporter ATP-binding protein [Clostridioides sp. ZZV14-6104]MCC0744335.1 ABC transporter ATP-binding protein [Clostridioides sp. ZZV14-6044]MCC0750478.1 ABC transporter ATP-binding protein [Clostridioides sp. ZZV13-5731]WLD29412.1 putative ABC tra